MDWERGVKGWKTTSYLHSLHLGNRAPSGLTSRDLGDSQGGDTLLSESPSPPCRPIQAARTPHLGSCNSLSTVSALSPTIPHVSYFSLPKTLPWHPHTLRINPSVLTTICTCRLVSSDRLPAVLCISPPGHTGSPATAWARPSCTSCALHIPPGFTRSALSLPSGCCSNVASSEKSS